MDLIFQYAPDGGGNQGFRYVFDNIYERAITQYPEVNISFLNIRDEFPHCDSPGGRCGISTLKIINPENKKATVLSFWDRGMDVITGELGWEALKVVHVIGGLGIYRTRKNKKSMFYRMDL